MQLLMDMHWLTCVLLASGITVRSWADVQLLWTQYQTLIWRPAELLNGEQILPVLSICDGHLWQQKVVCCIPCL